MNTQELVMDVGTVLDGDEAVAEGLIDTLGSCLLYTSEKTAFTKTLSAKIEPHGAKLYKLI